jgi:hypothetical protein
LQRQHGLVEHAKRRARERQLQQQQRDGELQRNADDRDAPRDGTAVLA